MSVQHDVLEPEERTGATRTARNESPHTHTADVGSVWHTLDYTLTHMQTDSWLLAETTLNSNKSSSCTHSHIEKLQTRGQKVVGGLEANFHKRSLCVKFSHNTCTAL